MWGWEVIVCFVNIGGIVDHHSLNFLFLILYQHSWKVNAECMVDPNNWHILLHMETGVVNRYQDKITLYFDWLCRQPPYKLLTWFFIILYANFYGKQIVPLDRRCLLIFHNFYYLHPSLATCDNFLCKSDPHIATSVTA